MLLLQICSPRPSNSSPCYLGPPALDSPNTSSHSKNKVKIYLISSSSTSPTAVRGEARASRLLQLRKFGLKRLLLSNPNIHPYSFLHLLSPARLAASSGFRIILLLATAAAPTTFSHYTGMVKLPASRPGWARCALHFLRIALPAKSG